MSSLSFQTFQDHNKDQYQFIHSIQNQEYMITDQSTPSRVSYFLNCQHSVIDDENEYQSVLIENCSDCSIQLRVVKGNVILRNCNNLTLSICCNRLLTL